MSVIWTIIIGFIVGVIAKFIMVKAGQLPTDLTASETTPETCIVRWGLSVYSCTFTAERNRLFQNSRSVGE